MYRRRVSRGYSILAALVFVAVLGGIATAVNLVSPNIEQGSQSATAAAPSTLASTVKKDPAKLEGENRCNAPIDQKKGPKEGREGVGTICVPGCNYRVTTVGTSVTVKSEDGCKNMAAGSAQRVQCQQGAQCQVFQCNEKGVCRSVGGNESGDAEKFLGKAAQVPEYLKDEQQILDALKKAREGTDPTPELSKLPSWYQDAFQEAKSDELATINTKKVDAMAEVNRLSQGLQAGDVPPQGLKAQQDKLAELAQQEKNLANVGSLGTNTKSLTPTDASSVNSPSASSWDEAGFINGRTGAVSCGEPGANPATCIPKGGTEELKKVVSTFPGQKTCPSGMTGTPPNCTSVVNGPPGGGRDQNGPPGGSSNPLGALGNLLPSFLRGLMGSGILSPKGPACSSDPNAYQQQQQQYQMQMQQYNYQLQQYNYQQQMSGGYSIISTNPLIVQPGGGYGYGGYAQTPPTPPIPCTPNQNQNTCPAAPPQPSGACNGTWQPVLNSQSNGVQCTTSWQCAPSNASPPSAQLSCQPKIADVGMSVAISYSCGNATGSTGSGFLTDNATSGSTTTVIATPPQGATGITYGLTCRNQNLTDRAECSVQIAKPSIVLIVNPRVVPSGEASTVAWITSGMQACSVSSPQMPGFTSQNASKKNVNGTATTSPITRDTTVVLTCDTLGGGTRTASTTILVAGSAASTTMSVTTSIDNKPDVKHGSSATITWNSPTPPSNSAVALWLIDMVSGQAVALIQGALQPSGTYTWNIPAANSACSPDSPYVCGADLIVGKSYVVQAALYTPANAHLGGLPPANPVAPTYRDDDFSAPFKVSN